MHVTIAIDGPGGAGKSSVADDIASRLGILHLDTGAMYRAFALYAIERGVDTGDEAALVALCESADVRVAFVEGRQRTFLGERDVSTEIRTQRVSMGASDVSRFAGVRAFMVRRQQELAREQAMVLDGRDIGAVVLPDATLKVFLTAAPEARARRRYEELLAKGQPAEYETVLREVKARDLQDTTREVDPLRPAADAVVLDNTALTQRETADEVMRLLEAKA